MNQNSVIGHGKWGGTGDRSVSYPFFSGYGRDEAFPQDTDLSPVPREKRPLSRALEGGFIAIKNCVNTEKCVNKAKKLRFFLYYSFLTAVYYE